MEGIFRLSGSAKRIKELETVFDSPNRYGKGLDWTGYTVHDAANILRRYLNRLPQPIVPLDFYEKFREPLRRHQAQAVGDMEAQAQDTGDFDQEKAIAKYQQLITELPPLNRQLLLYILDLLAVFASKSDINLMTSANLAAIFQPGLLSHPTHDMSPPEYRLSQDVLIFLVDNQDSFLIGMSGTAADEKTKRDVESGSQARQPPTPSAGGASQVGLGRSASDASTRADSLRKTGALWRNTSVSSKNSKRSANASSPVTPSSGVPLTIGNSGGGVHRSNTVPSRKSPGLASSPRFKALESPSLAPSGPVPGILAASGPTSSLGSEMALTTPEVQRPLVSSLITPKWGPTDNHAVQRPQNVENDLGTDITPTKRQKISELLTSRASTQEGERKESRQYKKLQKKRLPSSTNPSAQSSTNSLHNSLDSPINSNFYTPMEKQTDPLTFGTPILSNTTATPQPEALPPLEETIQDSADLILPHPDLGLSLPPKESPTTSVRSKNSVTDQSEAEQNDDGASKPEKAVKHGWRFSSSARKTGQELNLAPTTPSRLGSNAVAETSSSSIGSWSRPRKSITIDSNPLSTEPSNSGLSSVPVVQQQSSNDTGPIGGKDIVPETSEKKNPITRLFARVAQAKEERKEREAEKERAKSPPRESTGRASSKQSLSAAVVNDVLPIRGRSIDVNREALAPAQSGNNVGQSTSATSAPGANENPFTNS